MPANVDGHDSKDRMIIVWLKGMNSQFFAENFPALLTQSLLWIQAITFLFIYLFYLMLYYLFCTTPTPLFN